MAAFLKVIKEKIWPEKSKYENSETYKALRNANIPPEKLKFLTQKSKEAFDFLDPT